jgi:hypothetical protein
MTNILQHCIAPNEKMYLLSLVLNLPFHLLLAAKHCCKVLLQFLAKWVTFRRLLLNKKEEEKKQVQRTF